MHNTTPERFTGEHEHLMPLCGKTISKVIQASWSTAKIIFTDGTWLDISAKVALREPSLRLDPSEEWEGA